MTDELKKSLLAILEEVAIEVTNEAKRRCPVVTGRLRGSIRMHPEGESFFVGSPVEYAPYVEYLYDMPERGMWEAKRKRGGQGDTTLPFFRPAVFKADEYLEKILKRVKS